MVSSTVVTLDLPRVNVERHQPLKRRLHSTLSYSIYTLLLQFIPFLQDRMRHFCYYCKRSLKSTKDQRKHVSVTSHKVAKAKWYRNFARSHPELVKKVLGKEYESNPSTFIKF